MNEYTGRCVGIFTDPHALVEPTIAVLIDMKKRGITEKYSLGDNIGVGPNPSEVIDLLIEHNVISIAGNSEEYCTLGIEPFSSYFDVSKEESQLWTLSKLRKEQLDIICLYPRSIDLVLGGKNIALCHFANDVRCDYTIRSTWTYQSKVQNGQEGYEQFLYTNSDSQKRELDFKIENSSSNDPRIKGIISAIENPLFGGKTVDEYDAIVQGHVHWKLYEESFLTKFYSIRALGMAYGNDEINLASYVILREKADGGFDLEEVLVPYDREKMVNSILKSDSPDQTIKKFTYVR